MQDLNQTWLLLFAGVAYLLGGFVKGVIGGGLPAVSISLLGMALGQCVRSRLPEETFRTTFFAGLLLLLGSYLALRGLL